MGHLTLSDIFLRLFLAFLGGFLLGWERESHGRPAGLRTNILACVASALAMIVSEILLVQTAATGLATSVRADPARLGAGILTGIGFLGAGTIMRHESFVRGVTTAATLWFVTVLGLAFGSGLFAVGSIGLGMAMVTLFALPRLEKHVKSDWYATLTVTAPLTTLSEAELRQRVESFGLTVLAMRLAYNLDLKRKTLTSELKLNRAERFDVANKLVDSLTQFPGILEVKWE